MTFEKGGLTLLKNRIEFTCRLAKASEDQTNDFLNIKSILFQEHIIFVRVVHIYATLYMYIPRVLDLDTTVCTYYLIHVFNDVSHIKEI